MATFQFNNQFVPQSLIELEHIGEFALEAYNDEGQYFYLVARTTLGTTTLAQCGPVIPDVDLLPSGFMCALNRMQYKEDKIRKFINTWLNDKYKKLTEAREIDIDEAIGQFRNLQEYMENYTEENY